MHHARLRLNCSSLRQHLFSKDIVDRPLCECGAIEDTKHFFLECNRYRNLRVELNNTVSLTCPQTLNILHVSFESQDSANKKIFVAVDDFIVKSKRFVVYPKIYRLEINIFKPKIPILIYLNTL